MTVPFPQQPAASPNSILAKKLLFEPIDTSVKNMKSLSGVADAVDEPKSPLTLKNELRQRLLLIRSEKQQNYCADCGAGDPEWASVSFGIFICVACAGIHRHLGTHISRVKSLKLDDWTADQVQEMQNHSNQESNQKYWQCFPVSFKRIDSQDPVYLREEIIMDKYMRKLYIEPPQKDWMPFKTGHILKRGKYGNKWAMRYFKLINGALVYFKTESETAKELGRVMVDKVWVCDNKTSKTLTLQIIGQLEGRALFVQFESARALLDWLNHIRLAKAQMLCLNEQFKQQAVGVAVKNTEVEAMLKCSLIIEGYLEYHVSTEEAPSQEVVNNDGDSVVNTSIQGMKNSFVRSKRSLSSWFSASSDVNVTATRTKWSKVFAILTHDKLFVYKQPLDAVPISIVAIKDVEISKDLGTDEACDDEMFGFNLWRQLDGKNLRFRSESRSFADRWFNSIRQCQNHHGNAAIDHVQLFEDV